MSGKVQLPVDAEVAIRVPARVAFELRYILPVLVEVLVPAERESTEGPSTTSMLDQVIAAIDEAMPPSLRGLVDEDQIAEYRLNVIDQQRDEGTRPTQQTYTREQLLGDEAVEAAARAAFVPPISADRLADIKTGIEAAIAKVSGADDA